jgi:hypothetical protein
MSALSGDALALRLREMVDAAAARFENIGETAAARRPAPGKWSIKEIAGHLIDSASNNHGRFVRAQASDDLICSTYDQEAWVASQRYQDAPWSELIALFRELNRQIARVMMVTPADVLNRPRVRHNLHQVAFRAVPGEAPATLAYFMADYMDHLEHHLRQVEAILDTAGD